jgi:serine/threonine protein kinase
MDQLERHPRCGPYRILNSLAVGGMAEIFLALDPRPGAAHPLVVVKQILEAHLRDPRFVQMFEDERHMLSQLAHPNIVACLDAGEADGRGYIVLEHIWGESLQELTRLCSKRGQSFPASASLFIAAEVAAGLHHAHCRVDASGSPSPIIHRDVTLSNVVVSFDGEVKLVDFGIAKARDRLAQTMAGTLKGTLIYMSPEQLLEQEIGPWTDVYQLGVLLYQLLVGRRPFAGQAPPQLIRDIVHGNLVPPERVRPDFPPYLSKILLRAMATRPAERYPGVDELGAALRRLFKPVRHRVRERLSTLVIELSGERRTRQLRFLDEALAGRIGQVPDAETFCYAFKNVDRDLHEGFSARLDPESLESNLLAPRPAAVLARKPWEVPAKDQDYGPTEPAEPPTVVRRLLQQAAGLTGELAVTVPGDSIDPQLSELRDALARRPLPDQDSADDWQDAFVSSQVDEERTRRAPTATPPHDRTIRATDRRSGAGSASPGSQRPDGKGRR